MQIARIRPAGRGGHLHAVTLGDGHRFLLDEERALPLALAEGMEVDEALEARLAALDEETRAGEAAQNLLRYRPRSRTELFRRLRQRGFASPVVNALLAGLEEKGLLDDRRFARLWAESRLAAGRSGPHRVRAELRLKGVAPALIEETLQAVFPQGHEAELAAVIAERHLKRLHRLPAEARLRRLAGLLRRRGFSASAIAPILRRITRNLPARATDEIRDAS